MYRQFIQSFTSSAKAEGISRLKFYVEEKKSRSLSVYEGELERLTRSELVQMYVEGEYEGFGGGVFVESFDVGLIPQHILSIKESAQHVKGTFISYELSGLSQMEWVAYEPMELKMVLEQMTAANEIPHKMDNRILPNGECHLTETSRTYTLSDETGVFVTDAISGGSAYISAVAKVGEDAQSSGQSVVFPAGQIPDLAHLASAAAKEAVSFLGGSSYPTGECPVVLESDVVCELLDAFMPTFFSQSVDNHMSVLAGKLGQKVAGDNITIAEDPALPGGVRNRRFDDEGVSTCFKEIISSGVLKTYLYNRHTAAKNECVSKGNGFKPSINEGVSTGYTNIVLSSGEGDCLSLAKKMGTGLLITNVNGVFAGAHPVSGEFSLIAKGYRVENGKIGSSVKQITIAGNFFSVLSDVIAIGADERRMLMTNGAVCAPSLYVRSLMISGKEE